MTRRNNGLLFLINGQTNLFSFKRPFFTAQTTFHLLRSKRCELS